MNHTVITGTGRSGTSFIVHLLTELGLDTGFKPGSIILHSVSRAGLEHDMRKECKLPEIVKDPMFCDYADWAFKNFKIDRVIIPIRNLTDAANSRRAIYAINNFIDPEKLTHGGGLMNTSDPELQEVALAMAFYRLVEACTRNNVPMLFLPYPIIMTDVDLLFSKLVNCGLLSERIITLQIFTEVHQKIVNKEWLKSS